MQCSKYRRASAVKAELHTCQYNKGKFCIEEGGGMVVESHAIMLLSVPESDTGMPFGVISEHVIWMLPYTLLKGTEISMSIRGSQVRAWRPNTFSLVWTYVCPQACDKHIFMEGW